MRDTRPLSRLSRFDPLVDFNPNSETGQSTPVRIVRIQSQQSCRKAATRASSQQLRRSVSASCGKRIGDGLEPERERAEYRPKGVNIAAHGPSCLK